MNLRILVSGANGFVGNAVCKQAVCNGHAVNGTFRTSSDVPKYIEPFVISDINGSTEWGVALREVNAVVHLAARVHFMREIETDSLAAFRKVNVEGTLNFARQAAKFGVRRFVFVSSAKVNGESTLPGRAFTEADIPNPHDAYSQSKYEAELGLRQLSIDTGMEVVIIRPPLVYGPSVKANFAALMRVVQLGWPLPLGAIHNKRSFVALDNLVDFIVNCINHPKAANQTFFVSDGQDLSTSDLVRCMARATGVTTRLLPVPVWALHAGASLLGKVDEVQRLCSNLQINISKARSLLSWGPPISVDEGIRRSISL